MMARDRQQQQQRRQQRMNGLEGGGGQFVSDGLSESEIEVISLWGLQNSQIEIDCFCGESFNMGLYRFPCGHWMCPECMESHTKHSKYCPLCNQHLITMAPRPL